MKKFLFILMVISLPAQAAIVNKAIVDQSTGEVLNVIAIDDEDKTGWKPLAGTILLTPRSGTERGGFYDFNTKSFIRAPDPEPPEESEVQKLDERIKALEMQSQIKTEK